MGSFCIDAGHAGGNIDPGAIGPNGLREADVTLIIAEKVRTLLLEAGHEVLMTRESVEDALSDSLSYRAAIANSGHADVFCSIHCNAAASEQAHGTETWIYIGSQAGRAVAKCIQPRMAALGLIDRGIREANFAVLRLTDMPAVLVETAFITHPFEENLLGDDSFRTQIAKAIAEGLLTCLEA